MKFKLAVLVFSIALFAGYANADEVHFVVTPDPVGCARAGTVCTPFSLSGTFTTLNPFTVPTAVNPILNVSGQFDGFAIAPIFQDPGIFHLPPNNDGALGPPSGIWSLIAVGLSTSNGLYLAFYPQDIVHPAGFDITLYNEPCNGIGDSVLPVVCDGTPEYLIAPVDVALYVSEGPELTMLTIVVLAIGAAFTHRKRRTITGGARTA